MYPFFRYGKAIVQAVVAKTTSAKLDFTGTSEIEFRCSLTDIDNFLEMNNGRADRNIPPFPRHK